MCNRERCISKARLLENSLVFGFRELRVEFRQERGIGTSWESRFLVEEGQNAQLSLYNVDTRLIIREFDESPVDLFTNVFLLLEFEYMGIELISRKHTNQNSAQVKRRKRSNLLLQLFIGIVDTELLKGVLDGIVK